MPVHVKYDGKIVEVRFVDRIVGSELLSELKEVLAIEGQEPVAPNRIFDFREADTSEIKFNDIFAIAEKRRGQILKNSVKSAFLTKTNVQYGIARTFQAINDNPQITISIFREDDQILRMRMNRRKVRMFDHVLVAA